jgi:hypothetical protein
LTHIFPNRQADRLELPGPIPQFFDGGVNMRLLQLDNVGLTGDIGELEAALAEAGGLERLHVRNNKLAGERCRCCFSMLLLLLFCVQTRITPQVQCRNSTR